MGGKVSIFQGKKIRRLWNESQEKWYFSVVDVDCDLDWLASQAIISLNNPDEFVVPEVMAYMMRKISIAEINVKNNSTLVSLAEKVKEHELSEVRRYYKKIINYTR